MRRLGGRAGHSWGLVSVGWYLAACWSIGGGTELDIPFRGNVYSAVTSKEMVPRVRGCWSLEFGLAACLGSIFFGWRQSLSVVSNGWNGKGIIEAALSIDDWCMGHRPSDPEATPGLHSETESKY